MLFRWGNIIIISTTQIPMLNTPLTFNSTFFFLHLQNSKDIFPQKILTRMRVTKVTKTELSVLMALTEWTVEFVCWKELTIFMSNWQRVPLKRVRGGARNRLSEEKIEETEFKTEIFTLTGGAFWSTSITVELKVGVTEEPLTSERQRLHSGLSPRHVVD